MKTVIFSCPFCGEKMDLFNCGKMVRCLRCGREITLQIEIDNRLKKAFQCIANSQYREAYTFLDEANTIDSEDGQVYFAMLLCDLSVNSANKLTKVGFDFRNMPNYQNAMKYLDPASKDELQQCAIMNAQYMASLNNAAKSYPTPLMDEFNKANTIVANGMNCSLISAISFHLDKDISVKRPLIEPFMAQMDRVIQLYKQLSQDEINNLSFFDDTQAKQVFAKYERFKEELAQDNARREELMKQEEEESARVAERRRQLQEQLAAQADYDDEDEDEEEDETDGYLDDGDFGNYRNAIPVNQETLNKFGLFPYETIIEVEGYQQLHSANVDAQIEKRNGKTFVMLKKSYADREGNLYNQELNPILMEGNNGTLYIKSKCAFSNSRSSQGIGYSYVGNVNITGNEIGSNNVFINANGQDGADGQNGGAGGAGGNSSLSREGFMAGITINVGSIGNNGSANPKAIINGNVFNNNFRYTSKPIKEGGKIRWDYLIMLALFKNKKKIVLQCH